jgi:hypothetical protein
MRRRLLLLWAKTFEKHFLSSSTLPSPRLSEGAGRLLSVIFLPKKLVYWQSVVKHTTRESGKDKEVTDKRVRGIADRR